VEGGRWEKHLKMAQTENRIYNSIKSKTEKTALFMKMNTAYNSDANTNDCNN